jgi:selT/selW/selH-like putative selenoprotein
LDKPLRQRGFPAITTEVRVGVPFHYAEDYHQQYLATPGSRQYCSAEPTGAPLPAFDTWPFEGLAGSQAQSELRPKLPQAFWGAYDSSVSAPNEPAELSVEALTLAVAEAEAAEKVHDSLLAAAEREHLVIVSFCGGCGFAKRAEEFAEDMRRSAAVEVGLVKDVGITGNFDVKVRQPDGTFRVVHSKKAGGGFVDSTEKQQRIVSAVQTAREASLASCCKCKY